MVLWGMLAGGLGDLYGVFGVFGTSTLRPIPNPGLSGGFGDSMGDGDIGLAEVFFNDSVGAATLGTRTRRPVNAGGARDWTGVDDDLAGVDCGGTFMPGFAPEPNFEAGGTFGLSTT
jgi:hypothetical protein